ncbi:MAG: hypothetical protein GU352_05335 [Acidilobus sp.]|nr:hypothetical protein [Acidilobus sp.]
MGTGGLSGPPSPRPSGEASRPPPDASQPPGQAPELAQPSSWGERKEGRGEAARGGRKGREELLGPS